MGIRPHTSVIALGHTKGVGKDTIAKCLCIELSKLGLKPYHTSFAYVVKKLAHQLYHNYGICSPEFYEQYKEDKDKYVSNLDMTPRQLWIRLSDTLSQINPRIWFDATMESIPEDTDIVIISDLRYTREARYLDELDNKVVMARVTRDGCVMVPDGAEEQLTDWPWHLTIVNSYKLDELEQGTTGLGLLLLEHINYER